MDINSKYILTLDTNNNLNISGFSILQNNTNLNSSLNISSTANLNNISILSQFNYNDLIINKLSMNNTCYISGSSLINNAIINTSYINNAVLNNLSINSILNSQAMIFQNNIFVNSLFVPNNSIFNNTISNNSIINISGDTILNGSATMTNLFLNKLITLNDITLNSNLNINNCILNNHTTINSRLNISGNFIASGNVTINSSLVSNSLYISGQVINYMPEYLTNLSAAQGGVPLGGFYRSGGIICIRLSTEPPILTLKNNSILNITIGSQYIDPGLTAIDNTGESLITYLIEIYNTSNTQLLFQQIPIDFNTSVLEIDTTIVNSYILIYQATDSIGNTSKINRIVNVN
jgi:hypothetical protein